MKFNKPATASGLDLKALHGALLLIRPIRVETDIATSLGPKDAVVADVHVLDGQHNGQVFREALIWPRVLQGQLRPQIGSGDPTLGRLAQGVAKKGQSPPWVLADPDEADEKVAVAYLGDVIGVGALGETDPDNPPF
jgi:hypothetical protein